MSSRADPYHARDEKQRWGGSWGKACATPATARPTGEYGRETTALTTRVGASERSASDLGGALDTPRRPGH
eukprot:8901934-Alexandrium_andersonii.AAC.1